MRNTWRTVKQRAQLPVGASGGIILKGGAAGQHQDDDQRRDVLANGHRGKDRRDRKNVNAPMTAQDVLDHANALIQGDSDGVQARRPPCGIVLTGQQHKRHHDAHQHRQPHQWIAPQHSDHTPLAFLRTIEVRALGAIGHESCRCFLHVTTVPQSRRQSQYWDMTGRPDAPAAPTPLTDPTASGHQRRKGFRAPTPRAAAAAWAAEYRVGTGRLRRTTR